ncbi:hypothetical protein M9Y10_044712 [Tritrichomonas musculus]|uniref:Transmembrane protein n=1 Tax=Tritrichomonas musculus TaxID=1915356 RepID=A0ABR2JTH1_9EUKA
MRNERRYQNISNDPNLDTTYRRYRYEETRPSTLRFWIWIIPSSFFIIFLGWATNFIDRCRESFVFESLVFKFCLLFFITTLGFSSYVLYKLKEYTYNRRQMVRIHLWASGITAVVSCIVFLILFTISIYPAFHESSIAFTILASMLLINLGCLMLSD